MGRYTIVYATPAEPKSRQAADSCIWVQSLSYTLFLPGGTELLQSHLNWPAGISLTPSKVCTGREPSQPVLLPQICLPPCYLALSHICFLPVRKEIQPIQLTEMKVWDALTDNWTKKKLMSLSHFSFLTKQWHSLLYLKEKGCAMCQLLSGFRCRSPSKCTDPSSALLLQQFRELSLL